MKKKIFSYLLIGAMALSLVACSGKAEVPVNNNQVREEQPEIKNESEDIMDTNESIDSIGDKEFLEPEATQEDIMEQKDDIQKEEEVKNNKAETVTEVVSNTIERPSASNTNTKKPSTKKPSTKKPSTKKPSTKKPSTKKPSTKKPSTKKPSTSKPSTSKPNTSKPTDKVKLSAIHSAVKKAYGDNYIPRMSIDSTMLEEVYGIKTEWYTDIIGEGPMMSTHVDTFIAVQANKKNVNDVVKALEKYRDGLINDSLQYPMNLLKINASQILKVDNNVFFIMLGAVPDDTEESEKALLDAAKAQNQIAVNAIKKAMKK